MPGRNKNSIFVLATVFILLLFQGCAQKTVPHMSFGNFDIRAEISRNDIEVLDQIEGTSTSSTYLGVVQVIDGDKLKLFGIPFYKERYTWLPMNDTPYYPRIDGLCVQTEDRAYYKALEAAPNADVVFFKSMDNEFDGIPLIWETRTVTMKGKAIRLKADQ